ncbi:WUSCHEL-related homeobox 11-like [Zingiber officinale]|uniref:WUSCHEL-related homeobox 11-like n=1 Tax=Zingiber officinale TaxID=94328 RepID=UPI001C4B065E|nr:WUSCHEL-related homeobox 11-like [Zingiber officinale]
MSMEGRSNGSSPGDAAAGPAAVRSRWTPKPEQILILESIFNSGTVNPPKNETVRIRKLLEKFGAVSDANVFYWFQNRRSRSRRRQRELQAASALASSSPPYSSSTARSSSASPSSSSSSSWPAADEDLLSISHRMGGFMEGNYSIFNYTKQPDQYSPIKESIDNTITVFINGMRWEAPRGPLDMRAMFGQSAVLVHSSGQLLPVDEHGILLQSLQMGESYFLLVHPEAGACV